MIVNKKTIVLLGPPGVGKSTLSMRLRENIGALKHFSVRVYSEYLMSTDSKLGQCIRKHNCQGKLYMPDEVVIRIFSDFLKQVKEDDLLLIEGFPINKIQHYGMKKELRENGRQIDGIILLSLEKKFLFQRIRNRVICRKCELNWGAGIPLQRLYKKCPYCGGKLEMRREDDGDKFEIRMANFMNELEFILQNYHDKQIRKIYALDGEYVWENVKKYLEEL